MKVGNLRRFARVSPGEVLSLAGVEDVSQMVRFQVLASEAVLVVVSDGQETWPVAIGDGLFAVEFEIDGALDVMVQFPDENTLVYVSELRPRRVDLNEVSFTNLEPKPTMSADMAHFQRLAAAQRAHYEADRKQSLEAMRAEFEAKMASVEAKMGGKSDEVVADE